MHHNDETPTFSSFNLRPSILRDLKALDFKHPTPIQAATLEAALEGKDVIGMAQTGTGKTAAFALPIIQRVADGIELGGLVLAPTRELAQQITQVFRELGASSGVRVATIVGGVPMKKDLRALGNWPNVVVATPGRLIDHIYSGSIVLDEVQILAVDEADRMYDMGFMPQIRQIIDTLPTDRQTLMFTATMPKDVEQLARKNMRDPERVQIGLKEPARKAEQKLYRLREQDKLDLLLRLLDETEGQVLVFVRTKRKVDDLAYRIGTQRYRVARLHGDRAQAQRERAMEGFRSGRYQILVATDIAARGVDVADVAHVINFDFPQSPDDYIHRVGRTARRSASGRASSFVTSRDRGVVERLERTIDRRLPHEVVSADDGDRAPQQQRRRRPGNGARRGGMPPRGRRSGQRRRRQQGGAPKTEAASA